MHNSAQTGATAIYNPHKAGDGPPAKLWELLRRNPLFRAKVDELVKVALGAAEQRRVAQLLWEIDRKNPLAGYVLHWIFEPEFLEAADLPDIAPCSFYSSTSEYLQAVMPHLNPAYVQWIAEDGLLNFCAKFPFHLLRGLHVFEWNPPGGNERGSDPILGHIWENEQKALYPGELQFNTGPFSLDTPWPDTPEIFQKQFRWMWAHYDVNELSPFTGNRAYFPSAGPTEWLFNSLDDTPTNHERVNLYRENYFTFSVPLKYVYSDANLDDVVQLFKAALQGGLSPMIGTRRLGSTGKYPSLLGRQSEWDVFAYCYPRVVYLVETNKPAKPQRLGRTKALKQFHKWRIAQNKTGKEETHANHDFERMEFLMRAVYPDFQFDALLWTLREQPDSALLEEAEKSVDPPGWYDEQKIAKLSSILNLGGSQSPS